jgi:protein SCO1/2
MWEMKRALDLQLLLLAVAISSCTGSQVRHYELTGQVLAIDPARSELTIAHEAIPGYMQAMTMPFRVKEPSSLGRLKPGNLVRARLVVTPDDGFLDRLETTGYRDVRPGGVVPATARDEYILEGDRVPDVDFIDHTGTKRRLLGQVGVATVMSFIYTRCPFPTFCPLMDRNFAALQRLLVQDSRLAAKVRLLSVTIDPSYDTPAVLLEHAKRVKADLETWLFVTPDEAVPGTLAQRFGVTTSRDAKSGLIVHNLTTVLVDPSGTVSRIFRGNDWKPEEVCDLLERTLGSFEANQR